MKFKSYMRLAVCILTIFFLWIYIKNPIYRHDTKKQEAVHVDVNSIRAHVNQICIINSDRSWGNYEALSKAEDYIFKTLISYGYTPERIRIKGQEKDYYNIIARYSSKKPNRKSRLIVVGAHYDSYKGSPGADDNASGVAVLLELAKLLKSLEALKQETSVELAFYALEEPPLFKTASRGSLQHAEALRLQGENVLLMLSLESVGFFSELEGSQRYPYGFFKWVFPKRGNYISISGRVEDWFLSRKVKSLFASKSQLQVVSFNFPKIISDGVNSSDHSSFWKKGYPALMITDTAFYRNPNYHKPTDLPETLNYEKISDVLKGLVEVVLSYE